ncbi:MAG TPA: FAD-dependent oxidoreductase, partial [Terriglobales bacterium]|nr:FAD-dependent oxidoreductase [Terriglobales bacterium]
MERLFSPIRVGTLTLANRLVHVATLNNLASGNRATDRSVAYYEARARGGVGLIVSEGIAVHPKAVPTAAVIAGFEPGAVEGLRRITEAVHRHGVPMLAQLWHLGRQQLWTPISAPWAPSEVADPHSLTVPHAMSRGEIAEVVAGFVTTARHAREAGFDGVELHGAHGYLITQFLSPYSNRRTDAYGGSLENRMRFVLEIVGGIRDAGGPGFVLGVKLNGHEFVDGGIDTTEARGIARQLVLAGVDLLGVSQGNFSKSLEAHAPDMHFPPAPFRHIAREIREAAGGVPVYAMARFAAPDEAEAALASGDADLIGMSRALIADPAFPAKVRAGRLDEVRPCIMCNVCWGAIPQGRPLFCIYNPSVGHEATIDADAPPPAATPKRVVVIGGGLAGLEAARIAALRGHTVTLFERAGMLGGQALLAERLPGRADFGRMTRWLVGRVERLPIDVRLKTEATRAGVLALAPDAVVVATGARPPVVAWAAGAGLSRVVSAWDLIDGVTLPSGDAVVVDVDGEHEGPGVAELLAAERRRVTLVTPFDYVGFYANYLSRIGIMRRLGQAGVRLVTAAAARRYDGAALTVEHLYARTTEAIDAG